jgi:hypothetical protein
MNDKKKINKAEKKASGRYTWKDELGGLLIWITIEGIFWGIIAFLSGEINTVIWMIGIAFLVVALIGITWFVYEIVKHITKENTIP